MKINLFVNGNLVCDRSKAREHRGSRSYNTMWWGTS
nr:MAG TPA: hypothetical protein [Caudoviricetes sp.]